MLLGSSPARQPHLMRLRLSIAAHHHVAGCPPGLDAQGNCIMATTAHRPRLRCAAALSYDNRKTTPDPPRFHPGPHQLAHLADRYSLSTAKGSIGLEIRSALDMDHAPPWLSLRPIFPVPEFPYAETLRRLTYEGRGCPYARRLFKRLDAARSWTYFLTGWISKET